jgi:hypothetical protein
MKWVMMVLLIGFVWEGSTMALADRFKSLKGARFLRFKSIGRYIFEKIIFSKKDGIAVEMN